MMDADKAKTWLDVARSVFPGGTDEDLDSLLWEHTGFPNFWNIPRDGATPEECCRKQLEGLRDHGAACYRCGKRANEGAGRVVDDMFCVACAALTKEEG